MTPDNPPPDPAGALVDFGPSLQEYLAGDPNALTNLPPHERALAERLAPILRSARQTSTAEVEVGQDEIRRGDDSLKYAPRRDQDPIAIALGLVSGPDDVLDAARFKAARMRSG